jgi:pyruvate formate lyase activating enzyme
MYKISKRTFLRQACIASAGSVCMNQLLQGGEYSSGMVRSGEKDLWKWSKESIYYEETPRGIRCLVCPNECTLKSGETSTCRNRINHGGKLYTIAYGNPCAMHVDPIEKKPFFHFMPGSRAFSIATAGCNFACLNCQNWSISQVSPKETENYDLMPAEVIKETLADKCQSVAYTYSEPITFYEYVFDTSVIARRNHIKNVLVSNGYINEKPLRNLCKVLDAATIDLKSFDESTYARLNAGKLQPVLNTLKIFKQEGVWLEISNLVIPSWSDNADMIKRLCDWLFQNGFADTPLHFLRFQPLYKLNQLPPTPIPVLENARKTALDRGIKYVYIGNIPGTAAVSTLCAHCKKVIIERNGYTISRNLIRDGSCSFCGERIPGRWT